VYAFLEEYLPAGVSVQTKVSCPAVFIIGVWRIAFAVCVLNRELIREEFQIF
jgi:hypothetical protein